MGKVFLCAFFITLTGCSHKITVKNCLPTDSDYSVCDTLNLLGK